MYCMDDRLTGTSQHRSIIISQVTQGSAWHRRESKTMILNLTLHTSMSDCSFIHNGNYYFPHLKMAEQGQDPERQSKDNGTMVIREKVMALQLLILSFITKEQRREQ